MSVEELIATVNSKAEQKGQPLILSYKNATKPGRRAKGAKGAAEFTCSIEIASGKKYSVSKLIHYADIPATIKEQAHNELLAEILYDLLNS